MTMMILDGLLILVIAWGVMYAWRTSTSMQVVKNEMKPVTRQLGSYLNTIGQHLYQLRETTENNKRMLSEQLPQAQMLKDDFEVLLEHGNRLAERLDALLEQAYAVEKELRAANTGVVMAHTSVAGDTTPPRPYQDVMQQTPVPQNAAPAKNIYVPYTNTTIPYSVHKQPVPSPQAVPPQPVAQSDLDAARAQVIVG